MVSIQSMWNTMSAVPMGKQAFSLAFSQKAPYFATIRPTFQVVRPNYVELTFPKRRAVHNHIGTVHAIALCNGAEAAMGALAEVTIPKEKRWIPKGMDIHYTAKADSDIRIIAETDPEQWTGDDPDLHVRVKALTKDDVECFNGVIKLWVTPKPPKK